MVFTNYSFALLNMSKHFLPATNIKNEVKIYHAYGFFNGTVLISSVSTDTTNFRVPIQLDMHR